MAIANALQLEAAQISDILLHFQTQATQRQVKLKMRPIFTLFDPL